MLVMEERAVVVMETTKIDHTLMEENERTAVKRGEMVVVAEHKRAEVKKSVAGERTGMMMVERTMEEVGRVVTDMEERMTEVGEVMATRPMAETGTEEAGPAVMKEGGVVTSTATLVG